MRQLNSKKFENAVHDLFIDQKEVDVGVFWYSEVEKDVETA